jgi:hypothetical protein
MCDSSGLIIDSLCVRIKAYACGIFNWVCYYPSKPTPTCLGLKALLLLYAIIQEYNSPSNRKAAEFQYEMADGDMPNVRNCLN